MAHIKNITFSHVGRNEGCCCDRCGQWLRNIVTVEYKEGLTLNYGQDCFEKLYKSGKLNAYGVKLMRKALKRLDSWYKILEAYKSGKLNAETDQGYIYCQTCDGGHYWKGKPFEDWKKWNIEEVIPLRIEEAQKELERFSKIDFDI